MVRETNEGGIGGIGRLHRKFKTTWTWKLGHTEVDANTCRNHSFILDKISSLVLLNIKVYYNSVSYRSIQDIGLIILFNSSSQRLDAFII